MRYAVCIVPAAPVRKEDSHRAEMVNQLVFGETVEVLEDREEWHRVRSLYDGYEGWLTAHLIREADAATAQQEPRYLAAAIFNPVAFDCSMLHVPMGSVLTGLDEETRLLWDPRYHYQGIYRDARDGFDPAAFNEVLLAWMNAPYLWGGKTLMGVDCSGFVQIVFRLSGIWLKRDAWQQAMEGKPVEQLSSAQPGDLAFFHNRENRIIHVGILLEKNRIIHASGRVRIDMIDDEGIINSETGRRTHQLHSLRRLITGPFSGSRPGKSKE